MLNTIILIRHGETEANKENPSRGLTSRGRKQVIKTAIAIQKSIVGPCKIISTSTQRARESSRVISERLNIPIAAEFENLRVENIQEIGTKRNYKDLTALYFHLFSESKLPKIIPTPLEMAKRFLLAISSLVENPFTIIVVGHSAALESFANYQTKYLPTQKIKGELKYGQFVILKKRL